MIRGAIDYTDSNSIGGWIYSELRPASGLRVLAFLDDQCIGAGVVDQFRQDLADAGLGDGRLGFRFGITLADEADLERVVVKLDGSDLALIQGSAKIGAGQAAAPKERTILAYPAKVEWMRGRGLLEQSEFDFLKMLGRVGAYDLTLRRPKSQEKATGNTLLPTAETSKQMFDLIAMEDVKVVELDVPDMNFLRSRRDHTVSVVALWSAKPTVIRVVEGSHGDEVRLGDEILDGAIDYSVGPDRLLFLDTACRFGVAPGKSIASLKMFAPEV